MRKPLWAWSLLITLPITLAFFYWALAVGERYYDFQVQYHGKPTFSLKNVGVMELSHMLRQTKNAILGHSELKGVAKLRTLNLVVSEPNINKLDSHLPHSGTEYVKAAFFYDGKFRKVKMKYRGDSVYHWGYYKKSIRVKTKKTRLFEGMRSFNLVAPRTPEILNNHLVSVLAKYMGLMAPRSEVVNVNINGELSGIYILTEQMDESTLRSNGRMPGDLYSGDLVGTKRYYGMSNQLFESAFYWEKKAVNNHYPEGSKKPLERLINLLQADESEDVHRELSNLLDMEAFGKFNALEILSTSAHVDSVHNWRLYYDPMRSKFIPVVWDFVGWYTDVRSADKKKTRMDMISSPLHLLLYKNGDFLRARQHAMHDFFANGDDGAFLREIDALYLPLKQSATVDPNFATLGRTYNGEQISLALDALKAAIVRVFNDVRAGYTEQDGDVTYIESYAGSSYHIQVKGRAPVNRLLFKFNDLAQITDSIKARLIIQKRERTKVVDISGALSITGSQFEINVPLLANYTPMIETLDPGAGHRNRANIDPANYELIFDGLPKNNQLLEVLVDHGKGGFEPIKRAQSIEKNAFKDMHHIIHEQPSRAPIIWKGDINVDEVIELDNELFIEPGTTIHFSPGASLILTHRIIANGTLQQPIKFVAASKGQKPWGAVVLKGKGARDSKLSHCSFSDGSGLKGDLFEYTAMLSIHDVNGVNISHCSFQDSRVTDDMVHAVYSKVHISDSEFIRSKSDALDIDISQAVIERCRFVDSGNDAIDMMTTDGVVMDSLIEHSGDKGISVGEGSRLLAINNIISSNAIGVQSKDGSIAVLHNVTLEGNAHALDSYKKNWRYSSGGYTFVYKGQLVENTKQVTADKRSKIKLYDTYTDQEMVLGKKLSKRIYIDPSSDFKDRSIAKTDRLWRFPDEVEKMKGVNQMYLSRTSHTRRGADTSIRYNQ
ncbi:MAG: CotH kinase family protein [Mariprofundaceae bacterium]